MKKDKVEKIFLAMSGGVDSSLSAALLKSKGFNIVGVFIKVWYPPFLECPWKDDRLDAMRVAKHLGISFKTMDLSREYKKEVIDYMIAEYKKGRTPNPDVMCNKSIKFGAFFDNAKKLSADYIATGHYAQIRKRGGIYGLFEGADPNKDQSYFLWTLTQKELRNTLFPIGNLKKPKVRELAKKYGLVTALKKDSQGLCFVGKIDFKKFLKRYIKIKKGKVVNTNGEIIGKHDGVVFYTIGERHGFIITKKTPNELPYYIVAKDIKKNRLVVAHKLEREKLAKKEVALTNINWIKGRAPLLNKEYTARTRYRQKLEKCTLKKKGSKFIVVFKRPQEAVAPGQSLVLYSKKECLGGGVIL